MSAPSPVRRLALLACAAQAALLLCAVRHRFFWGGGMAEWLHLAETAGLLAATAIGGHAYVRALRAAELATQRSWAAAAVAIAAIATLAPPFLSNDIWDYLARGRVQALGENPYTTTVASMRGDAAMAAFAARANWPEWAMPYGPLAALLQSLVARIDDPWVGAYAWKGLAAIAHLATAALLADSARRAAGEDSARRAFVAWAWNPWLLLESCGSGHNDAFLALGIAAACAALARGAHGISAVGYGAGMLVKHASPALAPLLLATAVRQRRLAPFAIGAACVGFAIAASYAIWWSAPGGLDWLTKQVAVSRGSLSAIFTEHLGGSVGMAAAWAGTALFALVLVVAATRARDFASCCGAGAIATLALVLFSMPNFAPWYHMWWLPLGVAAATAPFLRPVVMLAFAGPASYAVFTATHAFGPAHEAFAFVVAGLLPGAAALGASRALLSSRRGPSA